MPINIIDYVQNIVCYDLHCLTVKYDLKMKNKTFFRHMDGDRSYLIALYIYTYITYNNYIA